MSNVAPHAGAWVETLNDYHSFRFSSVAPHAGAWVETRREKLSRGLKASLPMRERGLKQI